MKTMLRVFCMIAIVLAYVSAFTREDANDYLDNILSEPFITEAEYSRLDPYKLPDIHVDLISKRINDNKAVLDKGKVVNLSKVRRSADCTVPHWTFSNVSFTCFLTLNHLVVNYTAHVDYDNVQMEFYPSTSITGTNITVQVTSTPEDNIPSLRMLFINAIGKMVVTTRMISIGNVSDMIGPDIREAIVKNTTTNLHKIINGRFRDALGYTIYKNPIPFFN